MGVQIPGFTLFPAWIIFDYLIIFKFLKWFNLSCFKQQSGSELLTLRVFSDSKFGIVVELRRTNDLRIRLHEEKMTEK